METEPQHIDELKQLVRQNIALAQETNHTLRGMRRSARFSSIFRIAWISVLVGFSIWGYLYTRPYIARIEAAYAQTQQQMITARDVTSQAQNFLQAFFENISKQFSSK